MIVVARYNENLDWLNKFTGIPVTIYNKGEKIDRESIRVENVGRESDTYLRYIIDNYSNLAPLTYFVQGNPYDHCFHLDDLLPECSLETVTPLGHNIRTNRNDGRPDHHMLNVTEVLQDIFPNDSRKYFTFAAGAQYAVPASFIYRKSLEWWKNLYSIHNKHLKIGTQHGSPWVFERLWPLIFSYNEV